MVNKPPEEVIEEQEHEYQDLIDDPNYYITPMDDNVVELATDILNRTKDLNSPDYITIYCYLRKNFTSFKDVEPRLPVETIFRGSGSFLSLNILYTSMLLSLDYDAYTVIVDMPLTFLFYNNLVYIFNFRYLNPIILDSPMALLHDNYYENVTVISENYSNYFENNLDFFIWMRSNHENH